MTTAFVLSGGGNLGAMQAGSVAALMEAGIEPEIFVGASVGALNAAFLACRPGLDGAQALRAAWERLRREEAIQLSPMHAVLGFLGLRDCLISARRLRRLIQRWIPVQRLEETTRPVAAVATDALSGEAVILERGPILDVLAASAAIPGLFPPVKIDGGWLIDGSLSANHPVLQAQDLGAHEIYLIATTTAARLAPPRGAVAIAMNSVSLMSAQASRVHVAEAQRRARDLVPTGEPPAPGPFDYGQSAVLAESSYRRTQRWLDEGLPASTGPDPIDSDAGPPKSQAVEREGGPVVS